ncbi:cytochrome b [Pseudoroseomonas globiformis]|uniref:Cytochrome b n=1 Tax=Teichococcus globiformis TaxID=2307229 RepID=A0ABV7G0N0_9PROT
MSWRDTPQAYGLVSRLLHWGMVVLFTWQFAGMGLRRLGILQPLADAIRSTHGLVGTILLLLVLLRGAWGLTQFARRPSPPTSSGHLATFGHLVIYLLMLTVPTLALLRLWGAGRAYAPLGIPLFDGAQGQTPWLVSLGNALHGELAWVLLAVIAGHVLMVVVHRVMGPQDVLPRMAGPLRQGGDHH